MKRIKNITDKIRLIGLMRPMRLMGLGVGVGFFFLFASCGNKPSSLADVAEEDSLFIDTVATLDEVLPDTTALPDSLAQDSL